MSWQILVGLSVLLFSVNSLFHRVLMKEENSDPYAQTIAFYGLGGLFALIITLFRGGFHFQISQEQLPYFIFLMISSGIVSVLAFKSLKIIGASEYSILISSSKLWVVIGAFIFLQEEFSVNKVIGAIVILIGITIAQWKKRKFDLNLGVALALFAAFLYGADEIVGFFILRNFDAISFTVYISWLPIIILLLIRPKTIKKLSFYFRRNNAINISLVSVNDILATLFLFYAYQVGRNAAQIAPIMATQTIISVLLAIILLKERDNMINKIIGATIVVTGLVLVL